ncbi:hypothetical protein V8E51_019388 [Hyaloscypha variabilis]
MIDGSPFGQVISGAIHAIARPSDSRIGAALVPLAAEGLDLAATLFREAEVAPVVSGSLVHWQHGYGNAISGRAMIRGGPAWRAREGGDSEEQVNLSTRAVQLRERRKSFGVSGAYEWMSGLFWNTIYWLRMQMGSPKRGVERDVVSVHNLRGSSVGIERAAKLKTLFLLKSPPPPIPSSSPAQEAFDANRLQQETPPLSCLSPQPPCLSSHLPGPTPSLRVPNQAFDSFHLPSVTRISTTGATHILASRTHSTADSWSTCDAVEATTF